MSRPNPLHADHLTAEERRAELGAILARGIVRLLRPETTEISGRAGDRSLHFSPEQSGTAGPTHRRPA
jgi:hypothetical protein